MTNLLPLLGLAFAFTIALLSVFRFFGIENYSDLKNYVKKFFGKPKSIDEIDSD